MKVPSGFLDANGKTAKGEIILIVNKDQTALREFGATQEGSKISCYVLISAGDIPTLRFALNANIADHADFIVDGVRRNCSSTAPSKALKGAFEKVIYQGRKSSSTSTKRAGVKYSKMRVKERGMIKDMVSTNSNTASSVGSFEVRLFRTDPASSDGATPREDEALATNTDRYDRALAFNKCPEWYDCNSNLNFKGPPPPFQIEFINHMNAGKRTKNKVLKDLPVNCKLWATFVFHMRSTADLRHLGFDPTPSSTSNTPPATQYLLVEPNTSKKGVSIQGSENTEIENAVVEELMGDNLKETPKATEAQESKATPRPAPIIAHPTSVAGPSSIMSKVHKDESQSTDQNTDNGSSKVPDQGSEYYSIQGMDFSNNRAGLQRVSVVIQPKPTTVTEVFKGSKEAIQPEQEAVHKYSTAPKSLWRDRKYLPGVGGLESSPAHQAFLDRHATQESESRASTPLDDDPFRVGGDNLAHVRLKSRPSSPDTFGPQRRGQSKPPEVLASMESGKFIDSGRGEALETTWKPLTPLIASLKRQSQLLGLQRGATGSDDIWGRSSFKARGVAAEEPACSQKFLGHPNPHNSSFVFAQPTIGDQQDDSQNGNDRVPSEAPSDTETEVADAEDVERAVRSSHRTSPLPSSVLGLGISNSHSFKAEAIEDGGGYFTYPCLILGGTSHSSPGPNFGSQFFIGHAGVECPLEIPAQQARQHMHKQTPTPSSPSIVKSGSTPQTLVGPVQKSTPARQHMHKQTPTPSSRSIVKSGSTPQTLVGPVQKSTPARQHMHKQTPTPSSRSIVKSGSTPQTLVGPVQKSTPARPSPSRASPRRPLWTLPHGKVASRSQPAEKRKADLITGNPEGSPSSRKTTINPASRSFEKFENERLAAEARIATAEKRKEELQKMLEAAEAQAERRKTAIHDLNERAAEVERENAAIEARIASIYGVGEAASGEWDWSRRCLSELLGTEACNMMFGEISDI